MEGRNDRRAGDTGRSTQTSRFRNQQMIREGITVADGEGVIDLKGGPTETFLYVRGQPVTAVFFAETGTTWRYQIGKEICEDLVNGNQNYEELVRSGNIDSNKKLAGQFSHIIQLLSDGDYQLHVREFSSGFEIAPAIESDDEKPYDDNYGGIIEITATQSYLNRETVEEYKKKINDGERPIPILIRIMDSWTIYILDGHHKLTAYRETGVDTRALLITRLDYTSIDEDDAVRTMRKLGLDNDKFVDIYRDAKKAEAYERNFYNCYLKELREYFK